MSCTQARKLLILLISKWGILGEKTLEEILHLCLKLPSSEWEVSEVVQRGTGASVLPGLAFGAL